VKIASTQPLFKIALLKIEPDFQFWTPLRAIREGMRDRFAHLELADEVFFQPGTVSVELGADVYPSIIQEGFMPSQNSGTKYLIWLDLI